MTSKELICRLCFINTNPNNELIKFYSFEGVQLNVSDIISKHFWIKIDTNDKNGICRYCWNIVSEFNKFYINIEKLHQERQPTTIKTTTIIHNSDFDSNDIHHNSYIKYEYLDDDCIIDNKHDDDNDDDDDIVVEKTEIDNHAEQDNDVTGQLPFKTLKTEFIDPDFEINNTPLSKSYKTSNIIDTGEDPCINDQNDKKTFAVQKTIKKNVEIKKRTKSKYTSTVKIIPAKRCKKEMKNTVDKDRTLATDSIPNETAVVENELTNKQQKGGGLTVDKKREFRELESIKIREFFNLNCPVCPLNFNTIDEIRKHCNTDHNHSIGFVLCCNSKLTTHSELIKHMYWHSNPNEFTCNICNKIYTNKYRLKVHMDCHSALDERKYFCDMCNDSFTIRHLLLRHFRTKHVTKPQRNFKCDKCNKSFKENSILQSHIRSVHLLKNVHICEICAKVYKSKYQCQKHYREHIGAGLPKVQCQQCGALLRDKYGLSCHMKRTHNGIPMTCKLCGKIAPHSDALRGHMRAVHTERKFKCDLCEKGFKQAIVLKEHMATHTGTSILYACPYCPTTFNSNANLHSHRKKKHPREWFAERCRRNGLLNNAEKDLRTQLAMSAD